MWRHFYIIQIQYLGFRFHGWAKQKDVKTIHSMVDKTLWHVLGESNYKTLGCSRTDARVSANESYFELFAKKELDEGFLDEFNRNLPYDIRALSVEQTDEKFNIIQAPKEKTYLYNFCFGKKYHPFCAAFMAFFEGELDIDLMKKGAKLFEGEHNFKKYCTQPKEGTKLRRFIELCEISENNYITASFFPEESYTLIVKSKGFMRNQIRLMMGQLVYLGQGKITLKDIEESLANPSEGHLDTIAPPSGLMLHELKM